MRPTGPLTRDVPRRWLGAFTGQSATATLASEQTGRWRRPQGCLLQPKGATLQSCTLRKARLANHPAKDAAFRHEQHPNATEAKTPARSWRVADAPAVCA